VGVPPTPSGWPEAGATFNGLSRGEVGEAL
jgi:hypothetical protein